MSDRAIGDVAKLRTSNMGLSSKQEKMGGRKQEREDGLIEKGKPWPRGHDDSERDWLR